MKINIDWLSDYVDIQESPEELAEALTMAGLEVEGIERTGDEKVLEISVTPNRPDWLSHIGVAREVAAIFGREVRMPETEPLEEAEDVRAMTSIDIESPEGCSRYSSRVVLDAGSGPSPDRIGRRLESVGVRAISGVVDATNYVMLELGQPLHAFDYHRLAENRIVVRMAKARENLDTLDGQKRVLEPTDLLICDGYGPVALAGIMGGLNSEVMDDTRDLLLESARFDPSTIRRTSKRLGLSTEASFRFERGSDPEGTVTAVNRLAYLIREWTGGKVCKGVWDAHPEEEAPRMVPFRLERVKKFLGAGDLTDGDVINALERLGLHPERKTGEEGEWLISVPGFRRDLAREEDVIEEVARIYGYDRIPVTLPVGRTVPVRTSRLQMQQKTARNILEGMGFSEAITYTFISREEQGELGFAGVSEEVTLMNPISEDMTVMRKSLLPGLFRVLGTNVSRRIHNLRIYETGRIFHPAKDEDLPEERQMIAGIMAGVRSGKSWYRNEEPGDFFDIKGAVQSLLAGMGIEQERIGFEELGLPCLQPGQGARVMADGMPLGILGTLHPAVKERYRVRDWAGCFELDLQQLGRVDGRKSYRSIPPYPSVLRDLAVLTAREIPSWALEETIRSAGSNLEGVELFDLYQGKGIPEGLRSLAWSLTFQSPERTLTDEEVDKSMRDIVTALEKEHRAKLR